MDDIRRAIESAWARVKDDLFANHDELRKRVVRRDRPNLARPPREWCLVIRAGDTRLRMPLTDPRPRGAADNRHEAPHHVRIDRDVILALCGSVKVEGLTLEEAAGHLGAHPGNLVTARIRGVFGNKYVEGLGGRWGKPRPVLWAKDRVDPNKRGFALADAAWSYTGYPCPAGVPADFAQTLQRVPAFINPRAKHYRDTTGLHPEHPDVDTGVVNARAPSNRRMPPPEPDSAWYKWMDGEYLGYDWRNPLAKVNYERRQRKLALERAATKARRLAHPKPSRAGGSLEFRGWLWVCPRCDRRVRNLYWPIARPNLAAYGLDADALQRAGVEPRPPWPTAHYHFACAQCHRIRHFSRLGACFWNVLVSQLSGGLLYGHEVERPAWLTDQRKNRFAPRPNFPPPLRRLRVQELLLKGWGYERIAREMNISPNTVHAYAGRIYKQHNVSGRYALARHLGVPLTPPITLAEKIRSRVSAGHRYAQIASELSITRSTVKWYVVKLRERGLLPPSGVRTERAVKGPRHR